MPPILMATPILIATALLTCGCFAQQADPRPAEQVGRNPAVLRGLDVLPEGGMKVRVRAGECTIAGKRVTVAEDVVLTVEPPPEVAVESEKSRLVTAKPEGWHTGTQLQALRSPGTTLPGCYLPGSAVVKSGPEAGATVYTVSEDYLIDEGWGMLGRVEGGRIGAEQDIFTSYTYGLTRLDTIEVLPDGAVRLNAGQAAKTCPLPAGAANGGLALANVWLPYHLQALEYVHLFPVGEPFPLPSPEDRARRADLVKATRERLAAGQEVTVVCWGDSVTCGGDVSAPEKAFPAAFAAQLQAAYPQAKVTLINAGIGGSSTGGRLPGFQADVLDKKPDLVVVEFVNDMGMSREQIYANWGQALTGIRGVGAEMIVLTPHFTMPPWMGFPSAWGLENRAACQALRDFARDNNVALADAALRWQHLATEGLPYPTFLFNGINHPDDRGHWLFVEELMSFFR